MKIIAIADTHIRSGPINEHLPKNLIAILKNADIIIHAGDMVTKRVYDELSAITRLEAVYGNMDEIELMHLIPERKVFQIEGIRIGLVHEAALSVQDITGAGYMAKELDVEILVFGHIHRPIIERSDVVLVCPGSPTAPRLSEPSAVELIIEEGRISGRILTFSGTRCSSIESAEYFSENALKNNTFD